VEPAVVHLQAVATAGPFKTAFKTYLISDCCKLFGHVVVKATRL